jgi:hypothetical protein
MQLQLQDSNAAGIASPIAIGVGADTCSTARA